MKLAARLSSRGLATVAAAVLVCTVGQAAADVSQPGAGQSISELDGRTVDWTNAGIPGGIPDVAVGAVITDYGAIAGDGVDDGPAIQAAMDAVKNTDDYAVFIPAGDWDLRSQLRTNGSVVLRGAGPDQTRLIIGLDRDPIEAVTYQRGDWIDVTGGSAPGDISKGAVTITVADGSGFTAGGFVEIQQDNDPDKMYTDPQWNQGWAANSVGQFAVVTAVDGNTLTLREPLHTPFEANLNPQVRTMGLVERFGIEDLHLDRSSDTNPAGETITLKNTAYSWVSGVHSEWALRRHVGVESSYRCEIRDSYFHHAHSYGTGGNGYGVDLGFHVTGCLVENNIWHTLRHAMMVHLGANGNVFGYNYSFDSRNQNGDLLPDISLHGHYPSANLFEGNVVEEIGFGDFWGPAGPGNTMLRNCVTVEGLWYRDASHGQNIVGNELTDAAGNYLGPRDGSTATDLVIHGNYFDATGVIEWDSGIAGRTIPDTLYLDGAPGFHGAGAWPSSGADLGPACTNPAKARYEAGDPFATPPGATVNGTVTYTDGSPAAGVKVDLYSEGRARFLATDDTDASGGFDFELAEAGCHVLTFIAPDGETMAATGTRFHNRTFCAQAAQAVEGVDTVVVAAGVAAAVEGRVTHTGGSSAADVRLNLFDHNRTRFLQLGFTGTDGRYRFDVPGGGCYTITFIADPGAIFVQTGTGFRNRTFCPTDGGTVTGVDATLAAPAELASFGGRITDSAGIGQAQVRVVVYQANDDGGRGRWLAGIDTDGSGRWQTGQAANCFVIDLVAPDGRTWLETGSTFRQHNVCAEPGDSLDGLGGTLG